MSVALYRKAIDEWGVESQVKMAIEEASELITALCKVTRNKNGATVQEVSDEMADMEVMLAQLKVVFENWKEVREIRREKEVKIAKMLGMEKFQRHWQKLVDEDEKELKRVNG